MEIWRRCPLKVIREKKAGKMASVERFLVVDAEEPLDLLLPELTAREKEDFWIVFSAEEVSRLETVGKMFFMSDYAMQFLEGALRPTQLRLLFGERPTLLRYEWTMPDPLAEDVELEELMLVIHVHRLTPAELEIVKAQL
jgi:hypothetical protein